ncbi:TPA: phage protein NinX family protein [Providencia stuartii]|uniref:phage protein NinX family protein n=1 Tax=Providencia stuartii TaxID=588 RepID=UPI002DBCCFDB|nr:phage protein NinX family protein [Providencia stuartii]WRV51151.1 phage protein NinX family protein [Providencia stuartii]
MNKYTGLSDFEINKKVAEKLGLAYEVTRYGVVTRMSNKEQWREFNPCNNPADAMPIIIENKICMNYVDSDIGWGACHFDGEKGELEVYDKNYYRVAMICFLLMKDAENEKV